MMKWREITSNKLLGALVLIISVSSLPLSAMAQTAEDLPCDGADPYTNECPLDTWSIILVIAGAALGIYKLYQLNKHKRVV